MGEKVCIIGSGPGGHSAALRAAKLGAEVTVVEDDPVHPSFSEIIREVAQKAERR